MLMTQSRNVMCLCLDIFSNDQVYYQFNLSINFTCCKIISNNLCFTFQFNLCFYYIVVKFSILWCHVLIYYILYSKPNILVDYSILLW
jgi:hypothetical protein